MPYSDDSAVVFAEKMDGIRKSLPDAAPSEMVEELGLEPDGLNSVCAVLSAGIIMAARSSESHIKLDGQNQLFRLGITLGRAYERKLAASVDANSAGEDAPYPEEHDSDL